MDSREQQMTEMFQGLKNYSQQPPASVYKGIRKKLWWSEFMSFSLASLNVYYVGLIVAGATGAAIYATPAQNSTTGDFSNRTLNDAKLQRSVVQSAIISQDEVAEEAASFTHTQEQMASESQSSEGDLQSQEVAASTTTANEEQANQEELVEKRANSEESLEETPKLEVEQPVEVAEVPMKRIEPNSTESIESLPFDRASYIILPNLLEQIKDPKSTSITITLKEKREVEKEK
ncbi:hypothetical protein [Halocola ammonii]